MLIKPMPAPADPTKVCKTCGHHDPDLHVCVVDDSFVSSDVAQTRTCNDWEPKQEKLNVFTVNETIGMDPVNSVKVPLQPDGSLKMQAKETIGAAIVNPESVTRMGLGRLGEKLTEELKRHKMEMNPGCTHQTVVPYFVNRCCNCTHKAGDEMCHGAHDPELEGCKNWEPEKDHGVTLRVADPEEDKKQKEELVQKCLVAKEKGYRRGYMVAELHMMCDAASQLLPDRKPQWERLRNILEDALKAWWARNDQDKQQQEASHE